MNYNQPFGGFDRQSQENQYNYEQASGILGQEPVWGQVEQAYDTAERLQQLAAEAEWRVQEHEGLSTQGQGETATAQGYGVGNDQQQMSVGEPADWKPLPPAEVIEWPSGWVRHPEARNPMKDYSGNYYPDRNPNSPDWAPLLPPDQTDWPAGWVD